MLNRNIILIVNCVTLITYQYLFPQEFPFDTSQYSPETTLFADTGTWSGIHFGFHTPIKSSSQIYRGPVYNNWILQITHEIRNEYISYPIELQYWRWTECDEWVSSFLVSIGIKLRYPIYSWMFFGQVGIGTGLNIGVPINLPYTFGLEIPIANNFILTTQAKRGINIGKENGIFIIIGFNIKN